MDWCLNAVRVARDYAAAVLIRALEPLEGLALMRGRRGGLTDRMLCAGPARLCQALGVTGRLGGTGLQRGVVRIVDGKARRGRILGTPRIGVCRGAALPLRVCAPGSP